MKTKHFFRTAFFMMICACPSILLADTILFSETFEGGAISSSNWYNPGAYVAVANPSSEALDSSSYAMSTPGGNIRSANIITKSGVISTSGQSLELDYKFNTSGVGDSWWSNSVYLLGGSTTGSTEGGYMIVFGGSSQSVQLVRMDAGFYSSGSSKVTLYSTSLTAGVVNTSWNSAQITWLTDGTISLSINGVTLFSYVDTTYSTTVNSVAISTFLNNSATEGSTPSGRVLYMDDIVLTAIPEPPVFFWGFFMLVLWIGYRPRRILPSTR